jgi:RNA polymerase sigma-70 factor (ECF subfamily)
MKSEKGEPMAAGVATMPLTASSESLSELFGEHHRRILSAAYRITGSMADAEDVTQAVFLRLANSSGPAVTNAGSYLYRAAINGALDLLRRRKAAPTERRGLGRSGQLAREGGLGQGTGRMVAAGNR